jgi:hypothetical protein
MNSLDNYKACITNLILIHPLLYSMTSSFGHLTMAGHHAVRPTGRHDLRQPRDPSFSPFLWNRPAIEAWLDAIGKGA